MYRNHVAQSWKLNVPKANFRYCVFFDVQTQKRLDAFQEASINDSWNMNGDKSLSEPWIGVTRVALLNTNQPEGFMWVQGRLTKNQVVTTGRGNILP